MSRRLLFALFLFPLAASAQMQTTAAPLAGTLQASASGEPASVTFDARADVESGVDGCVGFFDPSAPDAVVEWSGGDLRIWGRAGFDATLAVATPSGAWECNDDADGTAPAVELMDAEAGRYVVWLGSFSPNPFDAAATLYAGMPPPPPVLDASVRPSAGVIEAVGGFEAAQGAIEVSVTAGGPDAAASLDLSDVPNGAAFCTGYIDAGAPTASVDFDASGGTGTLAIGASSLDTDLVLVVQGPDGSVYCDDDTNGSDPLVAVDGPEAGVYTAWVGTFGAVVDPVPATLVVSETAPEGFDDFDIDFGDGDFGPTPFSEGTYTPLDLSLAPQTTMTLSGDEVSAEASVRPSFLNPVQGDVCMGYIEDAPTAGLSIEGDGPVAITASSEQDLVMLVQTPSGGWFCSDDANGLDPGVQIDDPEAGVYKVWAGTFGAFTEDGDAVDVEVAAARGELEVSGGNFGGGFGPNVEPQSEGTYDGTEIRPGSAQVTADALPASVQVAAGGSVLNPVEGEACSGFVSERPTAELTAGGILTISAEPGDDTDLTLVLRTSEGAWVCSDDADGMNPQIRVEDAPQGTHSVWVGTFSRRTTPPNATLTVELGD